MITARERPASLTSATERLRTGHGNIYVTITFDESGKPFEVFPHLGKSGSCDYANLEAVGRLVSMLLRTGVEVAEVVDQLSGITCCPNWDEGERVMSAPDAIARALRRLDD